MCHAELVRDLWCMSLVLVTGLGVGDLDDEQAAPGRGVSRVRHCLQRHSWCRGRLQRHAELTVAGACWNMMPRCRMLRAFLAASRQIRVWGLTPAMIQTTLFAGTSWQNHAGRYAAQAMPPGSQAACPRP